MSDRQADSAVATSEEFNTLYLIEKLSQTVWGERDKAPRVLVGRKEQENGGNEPYLADIVVFGPRAKATINSIDNTIQRGTTRTDALTKLLGVVEEKAGCLLETIEGEVKVAIAGDNEKKQEKERKEKEVKDALEAQKRLRALKAKRSALGEGSNQNHKKDDDSDGDDGAARAPNGKSKSSKAVKPREDGKKRESGSERDSDNAEKNRKGKRVKRGAVEVDDDQAKVTRVDAEGAEGESEGEEEESELSEDGDASRARLSAKKADKPSLKPKARGRVVRKR